MKRAIILLSVLAASPIFAGDWAKYLHIYKGTTPVIDGKLSKGEYDDATVIKSGGDWNDQCHLTPVKSPSDLSVKCMAKHDGKNLYFAFDITDDVLYGIETDLWSPDENIENVHDFTKASFPWFGDGVELLINASYTWPRETGTFNYGDARSWQVVCNHSKSLLGGLSAGGLIQGEQRDNPNAWINHEKWIRSGQMQAVTKVKEDKSGYIVEWMITPQCLQVDKDKEIFWSPDMGIVKMGLNIGIQDLDFRDTAPQNWGRFHHEIWWAGEKDYRTEPRQWGTMYIHPDSKKTVELYISRKGSDSNKGTKSEPLATIYEAQKRARNLLSRNLDSDIAVYLEEGTYNLTEPLVFDSGDGGNENYTVTYKSWNGKKTLLSGAVEIGKWQRVDGCLWKTSVQADFRSLYKNDERLTIARYPNKDSQYLCIKEINESKDTITLPCQMPAGDYSGAEIVVLHLWAESIAKINSLTGDTVAAANPVGYIGHGALDAQKGRKLYLQNSIEFLDRPDEYYLDKKTSTLYYMAAKGENPNKSKFYAPVTEKLVVINGSKNKPVNNLVFDGISFQFTDWKLPQTGFNEAQSGHWGEKWDTSVAKGLPAAIELKYAQNVRFENCRIAHTGAHGIALSAATRFNLITDCQIYDIGGNGVMIGHRMTPDSGKVWFNVDWQDPTDAPYRNAVRSNTIIKAAQTMFSCAAVFDAYATGSSITNNLIKDLPYMGISVGFNWGYDPTSQKETYISYNEICDNMQMMYDGGAIYTLGLQSGTVISNNYIHNVVNGHGLYTDEGSQLILFERNIIDTVGDCAYQHHHGYNNTFRNNIFANARVNYVRRCREDKQQSFWLDRNIFLINGGRLLNGTWQNGLYKFTDNIYWITRGGYPMQFLDMTHGWMGDWQNNGHDIGGSFTDPLFADPANGDFSMPPQSPALKAGFMPIYTDNIGPIRK